MLTTEAHFKNFSQGNNISSEARDNPYDILTKNVAAFALILRICLRQNLGCFGLMSLREILKQPNIDSVGRLLVKSLMGPKIKESKQIKYI